MTMMATNYLATQKAHGKIKIPLRASYAIKIGNDRWKKVPQPIGQLKRPGHGGDEIPGSTDVP
jgi:hypothetical protein